LKRQLISILKSVSNLDSQAQGVTANSQSFTASPNMQSPPRSPNHCAEAIEQRPRNSATGSSTTGTEICPRRPPNRSRPTQCCFHCLALGHWVRLCTSRIWCRFCYRYGHIEKAYYAKKRGVIAHWWPKHAANQMANRLATVSQDASPPRDVPTTDTPSSSSASRAFSII
jgi:hypothetical protein